MSLTKPEMDTAFCVNWRGDRKSKWCRQCAAVGSPCFALLEALKLLSNQNLVLVNPKNGNRYQLEPPKRSPLHVYIQTLQGKQAHFALPIEDFSTSPKQAEAACMRRLHGPSSNRLSG